MNIDPSSIGGNVNMRMMHWLVSMVVLLGLMNQAVAEPASGKPHAVAPIKKPAGPAPLDPNRTIPPTGKPLAAADRAELEAGVKKLGAEIASLEKELAGKPGLLALLPDVRIYHNAVRYPLEYNEPIDVKAARQALIDAAGRIAQLRAADPRWIHVSGPRGYVSAIDGSVQPYIISIPAGYEPGKTPKQRFDFWAHGRGEGLMELVFLNSKVKDHSPTTHFVVYLYGRYCCANKFAGEIDCFEAMADVKKRYPVDENRMVIIGFSMGGAAVWQFATHSTDVWAAASPGAGFSESREYLKLTPEEIDAMQPWQRALWHWYDCTDWCENLAMLPTIAYAGEIDRQKQASDIMIRYMEKEGLKLERLIGPNTAHKYEPETKKALDARLAEIVSKGRNPVPAAIRFTTYTLRYNHMYWVAVQGLEKHWERARVEAQITSPIAIEVKTTNVTALTLSIPAQGRAMQGPATRIVRLDGQAFESTSDGGLFASFRKINGKWKSLIDLMVGVGGKPFPGDKEPGLQGPIDDAFMEPFLFVEPSGSTGNAAIDQWTAAELKHAIDHWRKQFRGEARVKKDTQVTGDDIKAYHLVCFGDRSTNAILGRCATRLPAQWSAGQLTLAGKSFDARSHVPVLIYPNPLNPSRYIVLNSGFTFREYDYETNARQIPKLPDYAVIDVTAPVTKKSPGTVVHAGFFDEHWAAPAAGQ